MMQTSAKDGKKKIEAYKRANEKLRTELDKCIDSQYRVRELEVIAQCPLLYACPVCAWEVACHLRFIWVWCLCMSFVLNSGVTCTLVPNSGVICTLVLIINWLFDSCRMN